MKRNLVFIGAGNVAHHLLPALKGAGCHVLQVVNRSAAKAKWLAEMNEADWTSDLAKVNPHADLYVFSISDDALEGAVSLVNPTGKLVIHTSGSTPLEMLKKYTDRCGVIYPFQTLTRSREINFREVPLFVEGSSPEVENFLLSLARDLSDQVEAMDSRKRMILHLSAVIAGNFSNHMVVRAWELLRAEGIPFDLLHPLILETARKATEMNPVDAQTGPAVRLDKMIMERHKALLNQYPELQKLYTFVSDSISRFHQENRD